MKSALAPEKGLAQPGATAAAKLGHAKKTANKRNNV
jgi:hypothetical protein